MQILRNSLLDDKVDQYIRKNADSTDRIEQYLTLVDRYLINNLKDFNTKKKQLILVSLVYFAFALNVAKNISVLGVVLEYNNIYSPLFFIYYSYLLSELVVLFLSNQELRHIMNRLASSLSPKSMHYLKLNSFLYPPEDGVYEVVSRENFGVKNPIADVFIGILNVGFVIFYFYLLSEVLKFDTKDLRLSAILKYFSVTISVIFIISSVINVYNYYFLSKKIKVPE